MPGIFESARLLHRLLPQLIQHGSQQPALASLVIAELPAANQCTLQLLLEIFHRLSGNAAVNEMDAHTVATVMTPCVAWNPPSKPKVSVVHTLCHIFAHVAWVVVAVPCEWLV